VQQISQGSGNASGAYIRTALGVAAAVILTFFAMQIFYDHKINLTYKITVIAVIAVIGISGIAALLTPEPDEPTVTEKLYTADEVAALLAAVQSGRLVAAAPVTCKFCGEGDPDATGVDGSRYHARCFRSAYKTGKT
jgi:hypothetical protein